MTRRRLLVRPHAFEWDRQPGARTCTCGLPELNRHHYTEAPAQEPADDDRQLRLDIDG